MNHPPLHIVGAGNRSLPTGNPSVNAMDCLDRAECRIRFLTEMLSAVNAETLCLTADGLTGFAMILADADRELAGVRSK